MTLRVFVGLWVLGLSVPAMAQGGLSEKATEVYRDTYYTYDLTRMTNRTNPNVPLNLVEMENELRVKIMQNWFDEDIEQRLDWMRRQSWTDDFKAMFVRAVKWRRENFVGGAEHIYRLSHKYLHVPNAKEYGYVYLSGQLLGIAAFAGHEQAIKEIATHPETRSYRLNFGHTRRAYYAQAVLGQPESILFLALTYLKNPYLDNDRTKGYYWHLRLPKSFASKYMVSRLEEALLRVSADERKQATRWIDSDYVPSM